MLRLLALFCMVSISVFAKAPILVGIAGGTGSGKTTLAEKIHEAFPGSILISQDSYYKDLSHLSVEERSATNFDHPNSLEFSLLRKHLSDLREGKGVEQPTYSFHNHTRTNITKFIQPAQIILVEGILLFAVPEIRDILDIKIFVETDDDIRVMRRFERDIKERSRDFNSIKAQYLKTVKPMHETFVEPSKKYADVIVPEGGHNQVAVSMILAKLNEVAAQDIAKAK